MNIPPVNKRDRKIRNLARMRGFAIIASKQDSKYALIRAQEALLDLVNTLDRGGEKALEVLANQYHKTKSLDGTVWSRAKDAVTEFKDIAKADPAPNPEPVEYRGRFILSYVGQAIDHLSKSGANKPPMDEFMHNLKAMFKSFNILAKDFIALC